MLKRRLETRDRLYGQLELPNIARELAGSCPLLIRLREVRMPNIPFLTYTSFANVSRYEHSLGVAHLAWWWAQRNNLSTEIGEAVTLGALYHDAATPAFSHLFEEFLSRSGFDHERKLGDLLSASPKSDGGRHAQVFLGKSPRLRRELAKLASDEPLLTPAGVASIATGKVPLGEIVHGDIDLDNIDNVIRATTAMGLIPQEKAVHPYEVASHFLYEDNRIVLTQDADGDISRWRGLRRRLYQAILDNQSEFIAQTTIKWALEECYQVSPALRDERAWTYTEPEIIHDYLLAHERSAKLMSMVRLASFPKLMFSAWSPDVRPLMGQGSEARIEELCKRLADVFGTDVYINFYVDKRERRIKLPRSRELTLFGNQDDVEGSELHSPDAVSSSTELAGVPGVIGAIGTSLGGPDRSTKRATAGNRSRRLDEAAEVLELVLGNSVIDIRGTWLGGRPR